MGYDIRVTLQTNGDLLMQADNKTRSDLSESLRRGWQYAESDFLEMVRGSYVKQDGKDFYYTLEYLCPDDILAMTDMPMLADNVRDDDDCVRVYGPVWGFPDYCTRDYLAELAHKGRVVFSVVADFGDGITFPSRFSDKEEYDRLAYEAFDTCLDGVMVTEQVPDIHGEPGETIARVVGFRQRSK